MPIRQKPPLMLGICRHFACENPKFYDGSRTSPSNTGCRAYDTTGEPRRNGRKCDGRASLRQERLSCDGRPLSRARDKAAPFTRMKINRFGSRLFRQRPYPAPARPKAAAYSLHPATNAGSRSARLIRIGPRRSTQARRPQAIRFSTTTATVVGITGGFAARRGGVNIDRHGRMVPKFYSKLQADAELRKAPEDRWGNARRRRVDAIDHCRTCGATKRSRRRHWASS
jgi:hypothetical protein